MTCCATNPAHCATITTPRVQGRAHERRGLSHRVRPPAQRVRAGVHGAKGLPSS